MGEVGGGMTAAMASTVTSFRIDATNRPTGEKDIWTTTTTLCGSGRGSPAADTCNTATRPVLDGLQTLRFAK